MIRARHDWLDWLKIVAMFVFATLLITSCVARPPVAAPCPACVAVPQPAPTATLPCTSAPPPVAPPLVAQWLAVLPMRAPNDDEVGLLVDWAQRLYAYGRDAHDCEASR